MKRKRDTGKMEDFSNVLVNASEFIPGRLYFVTLNTNVSPKSTACAHYFDVDTEQCYDSFYNDFGPLNLSMLYHYCTKVDRKLANPSLANKKIVHYTEMDDKDRVNAAYLIGSYAIIKLGFEPENVYEILTNGSTRDYIEFRDASIGEPYTLPLLDCLKGVKKALTYGFFDFNSFDYLEYEHYERVENGDLNWILPGKFIAFCGPHNESVIERGYPIHSPETYFPYFRRHNVTTIIRLNKKAYNANRFIQAGFKHKDLFFVDGGIPNDKILAKFMKICESSKGAIAVHCKAGLGRTGTLIACYIMKHFRFTAEEAIAWIRICRPGSIIAHQQTWLKEKQEQLWETGDLHYTKIKMDSPIKFKAGIYSLSNTSCRNRNNDNVTGIVKKVDLMEISDKNDFQKEDNNMTQGDKLNEIKAQRLKAKLPGTMNDRKNYCTKVIVSKTPNPIKVKGIVTSATKSSTSNRVLTKRNEMNESQQCSRRCSQRKISPLLTVTKEKVEPKCIPKKKENLSWMIKSPILDKCNNNDNNKIDTVLKRGKRTLALDKDKTSPHSVKVLRRSHEQTSKDLKNDNKLRLPSVKLNKSF